MWEVFFILKSPLTGIFRTNYLQQISGGGCVQSYIVICVSQGTIRRCTEQSPKPELKTLVEYKFQIGFSQFLALFDYFSKLNRALGITLHFEKSLENGEKFRRKKPKEKPSLKLLSTRISNQDNFLFSCRKNVENESYSEFYAESHFVLPFSRKNLPKKVIKTFNL